MGTKGWGLGGSMSMVGRLNLGVQLGEGILTGGMMDGGNDINLIGMGGSVGKTQEVTRVLKG